MAKYAILQNFYARKVWQDFRLAIIIERGLRCEYCGEIVAGIEEFTVHHIIELTPENVHDINISLNPDNVMVVHHDCHNKIHNRFGYKAERNVYLVFGAPLSGKHTFVKQQMHRGDIVIDMDRLYAAVSMLPYYDKPDNLLSNVRGIYNLLIDNIKTRYGKWNNAWVIGGYADKYKRDRLADELGAELILCDTGMNECLARLENDIDRQYRKDEWKKYIHKWFDEYVA